MHTNINTNTNTNSNIDMNIHIDTNINTKTNASTPIVLFGYVKLDATPWGFKGARIFDVPLDLKVLKPQARVLSSPKLTFG